MARVRRPRYLSFVFDDFPFLDVGRLLRGRIEPVSARQVVALSALSDDPVELTAAELELVASIPSDEWVQAPDGRAARALALKGVLLSDEDDPELEALRERHATLERLGWNCEAALYHFRSRWRGVDLRELAGQDADADLLPPTGEAVRAFVERFGPPPAAFRDVGTPLAVHELPLVEPDGELYDVLRRRRTTRSFDGGSLALTELAVVLRTVFGYHGYVRLLGQVSTLKRTSPSAGGFHPIDAYPLVTAVEGLSPGLYRYDAAEHALALLTPLEATDAGALATRLVCGQTYFGDAQVVILLAARFDRAFWKYRDHKKALAALLMDAGHLSQTLYLVAAELGLGSFVTAAVNNADADERLGVDGFAEGVLAACGIGRPADERSPFDPEFEPFVPRATGTS